MSKPVESTDRGPIDCFHFGAVFVGVILTAAGIIGTSVGLTIVGMLVLALGIAYFLLE